MAVGYDSSGYSYGGRVSPEQAAKQREAEAASSGANTVARAPITFLDAPEGFGSEGRLTVEMMDPRARGPQAAAGENSGVGYNDPRLYERGYTGASNYNYDAYYGGGSLYAGGGANTGPQLPGTSNSWTAGGQAQGGGGGGYPSGGGGMYGQSVTPAGAGTVRTQYTTLDPTVWNKQVDTSNVNASAGSAGNYATQLGNINPKVAPMDRTLYDQYSAHLMNPNAFQNNPVVQAALARAQQAASRKLAASRISKSGNAAQAISDTTSQALMGEYYKMADTYGQGAQLEGQRWQAEQGMNLDATKARIAALQAGGQLSLGAGDLNVRGGNLALEEKKLELARVAGGITSPFQDSVNAAKGDILANYNSGNFSAANQSQQRYMDLTGQWISPTAQTYGATTMPGATSTTWRW
jgi:hypothetical protein